MEPQKVKETHLLPLSYDMVMSCPRPNDGPLLEHPNIAVS